MLSSESWHNPCLIQPTDGHRFDNSDSLNIIQRFALNTANVVITTGITTITTLLDDHTYCARSAFAHLGLWRKLYVIVHGITSQAPNEFSKNVSC